MDFKTPYLDAIQGIPGETYRKKYQWIVAEIKAQIADGVSLEQIVETEKFPRALTALIQVEAAKLLNKTGHQSQSNCEAIAEALKSENSEIVTRALQATEFFDGRNKDITNVDYFFNYLFPHVSYLTRCKIIKKLSHCLARKQPQIAEKFFSAILSTYGLDRAMPLLPACSETFVFDMIMKHSIVLSISTINALYKRYPDLVVRYLKLSNPALQDPSKRPIHCIVLHRYADLLPRLIRKRLTAFIEIYEMHKEFSPTLKLSKTKAKLFARNARKYYLENPKVFLKLLSLEKISEEDMEIMFPKMFPEKIEEFNIHTMLSYLKHYPKNKAASLLMKSYKNAYGKNLLDDEDNLTKDLMIILPAEERIKQARLQVKKQEKEQVVDVTELLYNAAWRCYLPTDEVLPKIREEISRTPDEIHRTQLMSQMLFCCQVNEDYQSLLEVFKYIRDRHKNELSWFYARFFQYVQEIHDLLHLSKDHWAVLFDIIQRRYIKNELDNIGYIATTFLKIAVHFRLDNDLPAEPIFEMIFYVEKSHYFPEWNLLTGYPEYERVCLLAFLRLAEREYNTNEASWKKHKIDIISGLVHSMYKFNQSHTKASGSKVEPLCIKNYPWICNEIEKILKEDSYCYSMTVLRNTLKKYEPDVYNCLWHRQEDIADVLNLNALNLLKRNPENILSDWEKYFNNCMANICLTNGHCKTVHRFVKALRWYKDIPIKFVEQCIRGITEEKPGCQLILLAMLVHGETFAKFVEPFLPTEKTIDINEKNAKQNYALIRDIASAMKLADPPMPLEFLGRLCTGDYLSDALVALNNSCKRTSVSKVVPFAKHLSSQRVSVGKHGVRLMDMVANVRQLCEFLSSRWKVEEHYSIKTIVFEKTQHLFYKMPSATTWSLLKLMISTITNKEESIISPWPFRLDDVPDEYVTEYMRTVLEMIDRLKPTSQELKIRSYVCSFLESINIAVCNILPEEFLEDLLRRYLLNEVVGSSNPASAARALLINMYLHTTGDKLEHRLNVFSDIFIETVKNNWNASDTAFPDYHPVNNAVRTLITDLVYAKTNLEARSQIMSRVFKMFLTVLSHEKESKCYILLTFATEWIEAKTPKEFANRIGNKLSELMQLYTPLFSYHIATGLYDFMKNSDFDDRKNEDILREVVVALVDLGIDEATFTAVQILYLINTQTEVNNYLPLLKRLRNADHSAVKSLANYLLK